MEDKGVSAARERVDEDKEGNKWQAGQNSPNCGTGWRGRRGREGDLVGIGGGGHVSFPVAYFQQ